MAKPMTIVCTNRLEGSGILCLGSPIWPGRIDEEFVCPDCGAVFASEMVDGMVHLLRVK